MSTVCNILFQYHWALLSITNGMGSLCHLLFAAVACQSCGQQWSKGKACWVRLRKRLYWPKLFPLPENRSSSSSTPALLPFAFWLLPWCSAVSRDLICFILKQARRWEGEQTHLLRKGHLGWTIKCPTTSSSEMQLSKMEVSKHFQCGCLLGTLGKDLTKVFISM